MTKTIDEMARMLTAHADDLQFYANGVSEDEWEAFEQKSDAVMELVYQIYDWFSENGLVMDARTRNYIDRIVSRLEDIRNSLYDDIFEDIEEKTRDAVKNESNFLYKFFGLLSVSERLGAEWYDKISKYGVYNGETVRKMISEIEAREISRISNTIVNDIQHGKTLKEIRADVRDDLNRSRKEIKTAVENIVNGATADTAMAFAAKNHCKLLYSTALDSRVCSNCNQWEGVIFDYDDPALISLPQHVNCRCRYIPVPDKSDKYKELSLSFKDYFNGLSIEQKAARIGENKMNLMAKNEYDLKDYEKPETSLTIDELKARDKKNFA